MSVKIGMIGTGFIGNVHLEILSKIEDVEISGIMDIDKNRAKSVAEKYGAKVFENLKEMKEAGIQAVYITSPNKTHFQYASEAVELGFDVFCEKPMTIKYEDALALEKLVEEKGVIFQVGHNRRFAYVYKFIKEKIEKGEVKPTSFQIKMNRGELKNPPWVSDRSFTGGFLFETTLHLFDMVRFLFGDLEEMYLFGKKSIYNDIDDWAYIMKTKSGIIGTFTSSAHTTWMIPFERVEVYGDHVMLSNDEMEKVYYSKGLDDEVEIHDFMKVDFKEKWGYVEEDNKFIEAVKERKKPVVTVHDGVKAIEIVHKSYEAVENGITHVKF